MRSSTIPKEKLQKTAQMSSFHCKWLMTICCPFSSRVCLLHASSHTWAFLQRDVSQAVSLSVPSEFIEHLVWFGRLISRALCFIVYAAYIDCPKISGKLNEILFCTLEGILIRDTIVWKCIFKLGEIPYTWIQMLLFNLMLYVLYIEECMKGQPLI